MIIAVLSVFFVSIIIPFLFKLNRKVAPLIVSIIPISLFFMFISQAYYLIQYGAITESYNWFPKYNVNIDFNLDGLGALFALIITGIGSAVFLYAAKYMKDYEYINRFYVYITLFMASMLGVVLSDNLISTFIFWELTSVTSFLLIGFNHHKEKSRYAALQALLTTGMGAIAMLAGFILIINITEAYTFTELIAKKELLLQSPYLSAVIVLVLLGAFTKSAQFPFQFWLPNAMEAPTPVSAYLHSATMVKAGIYLMARMSPVFNGVELWNNLLIIFGAFTMILGAWTAIRQSDLKRILAYTTLSILGTLTMLLGIGTEYALKAMLVYLLAHSLYKGSLFLLAGIIDHQTHTRDIYQISGLRKLLPISSVIGLLALLSMSGVPPFIGFIGKELLYKSVYDIFPFILIALSFIAAIFNMVAALMAGYKPFYGATSYPNDVPKEAYKLMTYPPLVLALLGLIFGLLPTFTVNNLINLAAFSISNKVLIVDMSLWHGFNLVLLLSIITLISGYFLYTLLIKKGKALNNLKNYMKADFYYDLFYNSILNLSKLSTKFFQNGSQNSYIRIILFTLSILLIYTIFRYNLINNVYFSIEFNFYEMMLIILAVIGVVGAVLSKGRLTAVASLGIVGFVIALIFIMYGAPDLAMTQFSIESLTVVLFVLIIYKLPKFLLLSHYKDKTIDIVISSITGFTLAFIVLLVVNSDMTSALKQFYAENSLPLGKGANIVNVILVDFRALDTMGEITVLAIASIGIFALLKYKNEDGK